MPITESTLLVSVSLNVVDTRLDDAVRRCQPLAATLDAHNLEVARTDPDGARTGVNVELTLLPPPPAAADGQKAAHQLAAPLLSRFGWVNVDLEVGESGRGHPTLFASGSERTRDGMTPLSVSVLAVADNADDALGLPGGAPAAEATAAVRRLPVVAAGDDVVVRVRACLEAPNLDAALTSCLPLLGRPDVWSAVVQPRAAEIDGVWELTLLLVLRPVGVSPRAPFGRAVAALATEFGLSATELRMHPVRSWSMGVLEASRPPTAAPTVQALYLRAGADPCDPLPVDHPVETREMVLRGQDRDEVDAVELLNAIEEALRDEVQLGLVVDVVGPVTDAAAVVQRLFWLDGEDIDSITSEVLADGRQRIVASLGSTFTAAEEAVRVTVASTELHPWERSVPGSLDGPATAEWNAPAGTSGVVRVEVTAGRRSG